MDPETHSRQQTRTQKAFAVLPTLLTLGNAVCGFGAITILARVGPSTSVYQAQFFATQMVFASQLIFLAMLFDALDGSAARLTNQMSDFGAQLDSLADVISFGVAPAFMMLKLTHPDHLMMNSILHPPFLYPPRFLWPIAALFVMCAALRLARFNAETDEEDMHDGFSGLPSPAAGGVIAAFPIGIMGLKNLLEKESFRWAAPVQDYVLPALWMLLPFITLATASLMVTRIHYPHVINQFLRGHRGRRQIVQLIFALVLVVAVHEMALPVLLCWFAFSAPTRAIMQHYVKPWLAARKGKSESIVR